MKLSFSSIVVASLLCMFCIPTNAQTLLRGGIYDAKTKSPIENAKFGITDQGIGVITNATGKFTYRKYHKILDEESTFQVSATGYFDLRGGIGVLRKLQNSRGAIYLEPITDDNIVKQPNTGKIAIFWDASAKSRYRNTAEEITYLKNYLQQTSASQVVLTVFGEEIVINEIFNISAEGINALESILNTVEYKGISDYGLLQTKEVDEILLFAESQPVFGMFQLDQHCPVHIVNSSRNTLADDFFESLVQYTTGSYTQLNQVSLKKELVKEISYIKGRYTSGDTPVPYAIISKKGDLKEFFTDSEGYFEVPASDGDILTFYSLGNFPKTLKVTSETNYTVVAVPKAEQLETVDLNVKPKRSEYAFDSINRRDIVEGMDVPVRPIHKSQFNRNAFSIGDAINGIYGVDSYYDPKTGQTSFTVGGGCARVFIDGDEMNPDAIPVGVVENISIYDSMSMVLPCPNRIIVTTRMHPDRIDQRLRKKGYRQLKNNFYKEEVAAIETSSSTTPYFQEYTVTGTVKGNGTVLQGASIIRKGTLDEVITDVNGVFSIEAAEGDILEIKHFGMYPKSIVVTTEKEYTIELVSKAEILDEVAVTAEKKEETKTITTAYGEKDRKSVGYAVEDELSKFVSPADVSFEQVALKIPGVVVDPGTKQLFFQRSFGAIGKSPIMIVIDGGTVSQNTLNSIDPQTITNITALKGVAATNRYGSQAFGGVLLVETLNGSFTENQETPDLTLKNNIYKETLPTLNFDAVKEDYVDDVASKLSTKIKLEKYRSIKNVYLDKVDFYVDMALYFQQIDAGAAREVRNDFALLAKDNLKALRILAYLNEHAGEFMQAQKVYERVATMDPGNPQSYRDLALIYQETGEYNKALELYVNMLGDQIPGINFSNLSSVLSNELQRLINLYKHKINFQRLPNDWLATNFNIDVRMTASWSDVNAPFEFQFVNPKKRFYNWNSDAEANGENDAEKSTEEFVIDDATPGKWLINVRYTGDENATNIPPYLKYTVYRILIGIHILRLLLNKIIIQYYSLFIEVYIIIVY